MARGSGDRLCQFVLDDGQPVAVLMSGTVCNGHQLDSQRTPAKVIQLIFQVEAVQ